MQSAPAPEFSFAIEIAQIPSGGATYAISAPAEARARVARRLGIVSIERLEANFVVKPVAGGIVSVSGRLAATLVQSCVVSLAPVPATITEEIDARFMPEDLLDRRDAADDVALEDEDPPDVAQGGRIDLGELAVTQLALVLDPYPRAPGVSFDAAPWSAGGGQDRASPFAALASLKKKQQS